MSGRVVRIDIIGEGASGAKAFASVDAAAGKTEGVLGKLGGGIGKVGSAFGTMAKVAGGFVLAQGILAAPGALLNMAKAAADDSASMGRLQQAVENTGGSWDALKGTYEGVIKSGQDLAFSDDDIRDGMVNLLNATGDSDEAMRRMSSAQDLARGTGMDLNTATKLLGKASDENTGILARYGIVVGENATAQDLMNEVDKRFGGQAAKYAESDAGKIARLTDRWGELQETIGYMVLPVLSAVVDLLLDKVIPALETATTKLGGFVTKAAELGVVLRGRLTKAFTSVQPYIDTFLQVAKDLHVVLAGPLAAAIIGMIKGFGQDGLAGVLPGAVEGLQGFVTALGDLAMLALGAIEQTDWSAVAGAIVDGIVVGITAITDFGTRFATWASGQFAAVDWSATGVAMLAGIALGWTTVTDFGTRFATWASAQFTAVPWDAAGAAMLTGIAAGWTTVTDFGTRLVTWVGAQLMAVETEAWAPTGEAVLIGIGTAILSFTGWGMVALVVAKLALWLKDGVGGGEWSGVATAILDKIAEGWETVTDFGTRFVTWLQEQYAAVDWSGVATTIQTGISNALAALSGGEDGGGGFLQPLIDEIAGLAGKLTPAFEEIKTATATFVENLKPSYNDLKLAIDQLAIAWDNVKQAYMDAAEELGKHDWGPEKEALITLATVGLGGVILAARTLSLAILALALVLRGLSELNNTVIVPAIKVVELALDLLSTQVNDTWQIVSTAWDIATGIPGTITTGANAIQTTIASTMTAVSTAWSGAWDGIRGVVDTAWNGANGIVRLADGGASSVKTLVSDAIGGLVTTWSGAWDGITGKVSGAAGEIIGSISGITGAIGDVVSAASGIGSGFAGGLQAAYNTVVGWVDKIIGQLDRIPSWLRPGSPSKTMYEYGAGFVQGFVNGVKAYMPALAQTMTAFNNALVPTGGGGGAALQQLAAAQQAALEALTVAGQQLQAVLTTGNQTMIAQAQYAYQQAILAYQQAQAAYQAGVLAPPAGGGGGGGGGGGTPLQQLAGAQQHALDVLTVAGQQLDAAIATGNQTQIAQAQYAYQQAILAYQQAQAAYQAGVLAPPPGGVPGAPSPPAGPTPQEQSQAFYSALHNIQGGGVGAPSAFAKGGQSAGGFQFAGGSVGGPSSVPAGSVSIAAYVVISLADFVKQVLDPTVAPLMLQLGVHSGPGVP